MLWVPSYRKVYVTATTNLNALSIVHTFYCP